MPVRLFTLWIVVTLLAGCAGGDPAAPPAPTPVRGLPGGSPTPAGAALAQASSTPSAAPVDTPVVPASGDSAAVTQLPTALPTPAEAIPTQAAAPAAPTPACGNGSPALTRADMEGPYYLPGAPERSSLVEPGMSGTRLLISGYVVHADCSPAAGARLDFWQADAGGQYDLNGYRLRGSVTADANGYYQVETILPAVYGGRPRHIHVKVTAGGEPLTTQLYFPGDAPYPDLTVALSEQTPESAAAFFNFVVP